MSQGKKIYVDEELESAVLKLKDIGDFSTKRKASKRAGEILNAGLDEMADGVRKELEITLDEDEEYEDPDDDFGIKHDMLGI